ncbi:zinc finger, CCHC-type containing protein, partial [Tanacetum coccineum]
MNSKLKNGEGTSNNAQNSGSHNQSGGFFKINGNGERDKIVLASMHVYAKALIWHQQFCKRFTDECSWELYEKEAIKRFDFVFDDPLMDLKNSGQDGTIKDYHEYHEGYKNTIELPVGNNVVPLRSDTIRLVQNGCSFYELRFEDPNQHLNDFFKLVDSLDLDGVNRERTRTRLFQFSLRDQASNWLERLPAGSITTWEDLTAHFLAQFFPP